MHVFLKVDLLMKFNFLLINGHVSTYNAGREKASVWRGTEDTWASVPAETPFSGASAHNAMLILHRNPSAPSSRKTKEDC